MATSCSPKRASVPTHELHSKSFKNESLPHAGFYDNAQGSPIFRMISQAQVSIDIEIYEMSDSTVLSALEEALSRNVRIRVVKEPDPLGANCRLFLPLTKQDNPNCKKQKELKAKILSSGGSYVPFKKAALCMNSKKACYQHGKLLIADSQAAMISTGNFNTTNLCNLAAKPSKCNRDYSVVVRDDQSVHFLTEIFEKDLAGEKYDVQAITELRGIENLVTVSPFSLEPLLKLITSATQSIKIQNQYLKEPLINQALVEAAKRGVQVEMTLASFCSFGPPTESSIPNLTAQFSAFEASGISVRLLPSQFRINGKPGYLHSKAIVVDQKTAWVGSVNGSITSVSNNREFGVFFSESEWVTSLLQVMVSDHTSADMATWQQSIRCEKD